MISLPQLLCNDGFSANVTECGLSHHSFYNQRRQLMARPTTNEKKLQVKCLYLKTGVPLV